MAVINITKDSFETEVIKSDKPVIIDFWAAWCGPCQMMGPVIEELSEEFTDIKFVKLNVDMEPELAAQFNVMSITTFIRMENGKEVKKTLGAMPKDELADLFGLY